MPKNTLTVSALLLVAALIVLSLVGCTAEAQQRDRTARCAAEAAYAADLLAILDSGIAGQYDTSQIEKEADWALGWLDVCIP